MHGPGNSAGRDCSGRGLCDYSRGVCQCFLGYYGTSCQHQVSCKFQIWRTITPRTLNSLFNFRRLYSSNILDSFLSGYIVASCYYACTVCTIDQLILFCDNIYTNLVYIYYCRFWKPYNGRTHPYFHILVRCDYFGTLLASFTVDSASDCSASRETITSQAGV